MTTRAKVFMNGRSQAVRLPLDFRFTTKEVYIRKDEKTGDVILSEKPRSWDDFFALADETSDEAADFLIHRSNENALVRDIFTEKT